MNGPKRCDTPKRAHQKTPPPHTDTILRDVGSSHRLAGADEFRVLSPRQQVRHVLKAVSAIDERMGSGPGRHLTHVEPRIVDSGAQNVRAEVRERLIVSVE